MSNDGFAAVVMGGVPAPALPRFDEGLLDRQRTEAAALEAWLGPSRVTPRFRTPLERELSA